MSMTRSPINWNILLVGGLALGGLYYWNKIQSSGGGIIKTATDYTSGVTGSEISTATQPTVRTDLRQSARTQRADIRQSERTARVDSRTDRVKSRTDRVEARQQEQTARVETRQDARTDRAVNRQQTRITNVATRQDQRTTRVKTRVAARQQLRSNAVNLVRGVVNRVSQIKQKIKKK
jgi:hypothetical protein